MLLAALRFLRPTGLPAWLQPPVTAIPLFVLAFGLVFKAAYRALCEAKSTGAVSSDGP